MPRYFYEVGKNDAYYGREPLWMVLTLWIEFRFKDQYLSGYEDELESFS